MFYKMLLRYSPSHIKWLVTIYSATLLSQKIFLSTKREYKYFRYTFYSVG